ncbi:MAG: tail fiber domain-containing protein [Bacteroidota bacterium]
MKYKLILLTLFLYYATIAKTQSYNTATGTYALGSVTSGDANTATGYQALYSNTGNWNNSAHGSWALVYNNTADYNSAYGGSALFYTGYTGNGYQNAALGFRALYNNNYGIGNTAIGHDALFNNSSGQYNTSVGQKGLYANTTGSYNSVIGPGAEENQTGDYNTYLGYNADNGSTNTNYDNTTVIGARSYNSASNRILVGTGTHPGVIEGEVDYSIPSDKRIKRNIMENVPGLAFINLLKPVTYHFNVAAYLALVHPHPLKDSADNFLASSSDDLASINEKEKIVQTGFLAQDVESAAKSLQYDFSGVDAPTSSDQVYSLRYAEFVVPLVKATQELNQKNDALVKKINELKMLKDLMMARIDELRLLQASCCQQNTTK